MRIAFNFEHKKPIKGSGSISTVLCTEDDWYEDDWADLMVWLEESPFLLETSFKVFKGIGRIGEYIVEMVADVITFPELTALTA